MTNKLTIHMREEGKVEFESKKPIGFDDLLSVTMSLNLGFMRQLVSNTPLEHAAEAKGMLYDAFNKAASEILEQFAPEYELRPGLTAQAIMEAENAIVMRGGLKDVEVGS